MSGLRSGLLAWVALALPTVAVHAQPTTTTPPVDEPPPTADSASALPSASDDTTPPATTPAAASTTTASPSPSTPRSPAPPPPPGAVPPAGATPPPGALPPAGAAPPPGALPPAGATPPPGATPPAGGDAPEADRAEYEARREALKQVIEELLVVPDNPAAFALGMASAPVARPGTIREATAALSALIGPNGKLQPGVSAEIAPVRIASRPRTVEAWSETSGLVRVLDSLRISIATAEDPSAQGEDAPALAAVGTRIGYHSNDYRWNASLRAAVRQTLARCAPGAGQVPPGSGDNIGDYTEVGSNHLASNCDASELNGALSDLYAGALDEGFRIELALNTVFASATVLPDGDSDWRATRSWLTTEYDFGRLSLGVGADLTYRAHPELPADDNTAIDVRAAGFGEVGADDVRWEFSAGYTRANEGSDAIDAKDLLQLGTSIALEVSSSFAAKVGLQAQCEFGGDCDAIVIASATVAGAENPLEWTYRAAPSQ